MRLLQSQIDRELYLIKKWYQRYYPLCGYCGHLVRNGGELSHFIRRSYSRELQTVKLNCCISHHDCHQIYDENQDQAIFLPRIIEVLYIVFTLDSAYFYQISDHFEPLQDVFARFPDIDLGELDHHGDIIQLYYLYLPDQNYRP